jgi:hypothetical protein
MSNSGSVRSGASLRRGGGGGRDRSSNSSNRSSGGSSRNSPPKVPSDHPRAMVPPQNDLEELEFKLQESVNVEFFKPPHEFYTTHFVIDVLGAQLNKNNDEQTTTTNPEELRQHNPAYKALKQQQQVVEQAIEHMAIAHCADLNASVVHVGRVSRQFQSAVQKVQSLQSQVQTIQETLGTSNNTNTSIVTTSNGTTTTTTSAAHAAAMSLRELWLKKLECEAILSLLEKMNVVRHSPAEFDALVQRGKCRIGAAVNVLSEAFEIAFDSEVTYVAALQTISQQITNRKQIANSIIWESLEQVLYLRTGNGTMEQLQQQQQHSNQVSKQVSSGATAASVESKLTRISTSGMKNPFLVRGMKFMDEDPDWDAQSLDTVTSASSLFSKDSTVSSGISNKGNPTSSTPTRIPTRMMIPLNILEAELDLEQDERRCLVPTSTGTTRDWDYSRLPQYQDSVLALRILTECLKKLGRLDDVERTLHENLESELRRLAQTEQARTFMRLERGIVRRSSNRRQDLKDFRRHLRGLLSSFGCVMLRLSHLAQILRHVIVSTISELRLNKRGRAPKGRASYVGVVVGALDGANDD